jgi:hypothetical protein
MEVKQVEFNFLPILLGDLEICVYLIEFIRYYSGFNKGSQA